MATRPAFPFLLVLLATIAAGCSESEPPSDAPAPGTVAADAPSPAETLDCDTVPFQDRAAVQAPLTNWRLAYGRMCPVLGGALSDCPQLIGAGEDDILRCLRQNIDADDDCPDAMRDALRDAVDGLDTATRCRTLHAELVDAAIRDAAADYGELPPRTVSGATDRCRRQNPFDPVEARGCVVLLLTTASVEQQREEERAAARKDRLAAIDAVIEGAQDIPPPGIANAIRRHCDLEDPQSAAAAACATDAVTAYHMQQNALTPIPTEYHPHAIRQCVRAKLAGHPALPFAHPDCITEDASAFEEITANYPEHFDDCGRSKYRYSEMLGCVKRRWLTKDRIDAARAMAVERHIAPIRPERVRDAIDRVCDRRPTARDLTRRDSLVPGEHARDIVDRRVRTCVDTQQSAYAAIRRFAGTTHADAVNTCIGSVNINLYGWRIVAYCLRNTARDAGDTEFAAALTPCLANYIRTSRKDLQVLLDCPDVPPR